MRGEGGVSDASKAASNEADSPVPVDGVPVCRVPVDGMPVDRVPVDGVPVDGSLTGIVQTWGLVKPEFSGESWKDLVICTAL